MPPPPPFLIFGVLVPILIIFLGICSLIFSKASRLKKNETQIREFSAVFDIPRLMFCCFVSYYGNSSQNFLTLFSYVSRFQKNESKNNLIFGSFGSHFGIFPYDYCVIFKFSVEYCKISENYSKINLYS